MKKTHPKYKRQRPPHRRMVAPPVVAPVADIPADVSPLPAAVLTAAAPERHRAISLYLVLLCSAVLTLWLSQDSIETYWQQTYHRASPLAGLQRFDAWQAGGRWQAQQQAHYQAMQDRFAQQMAHWLPGDAAPAVVAVATPASTDSVPETGVMAAVVPSPAVFEGAPPTGPAARAVLHPGERVFFAGDSMMQGVAPHVQRWLSGEHGIASLNLSRQSTGLSYPGFFDWPATIERTLAEHPDIRLLVVFLGPNDPWDIPNPEPGGKGYVHFKTPAWEQIYRQRVRRIVAAARAARVQLIWVGIPPMQGRKLDGQMRYLDALLAEELREHTLWLPTEALMGGQPYRDSVDIDGRRVRLRSKDGIHFTPRGQQHLAEYIRRHIDVRTAGAVISMSAAASAPGQ